MYSFPAGVPIKQPCKVRSQSFLFLYFVLPNSKQWNQVLEFLKCYSCSSNSMQTWVVRYVVFYRHICMDICVCIYKTLINWKSGDNFPFATCIDRLTQLPWRPVLLKVNVHMFCSIRTEQKVPYVSSWKGSGAPLLGQLLVVRKGKSLQVKSMKLVFHHLTFLTRQHRAAFL